MMEELHKENGTLSGKEAFSAPLLRLIRFDAADILTNSQTEEATDPNQGTWVP